MLFTYHACGVGRGPMPLGVHPSIRTHWKCSVINLSLPFHLMTLQSVCLLVNSLDHQGSHWIVGILCFSSVTLVTSGSGDAVRNANVAGGMVTFCCVTEQEQHLLIYTNNQTLTIKQHSKYICIRLNFLVG